ncbi:MAG TPA: caspase family protein [Thermoanaerobaculia bacterium]|nr:caspase family protein [Thermoanaerobaculia bacterium]
MAKRAAICIGVNHAGTMPALQAAAKGALQFAEWAKTQDCDVTTFTDEAKISVNDIFDAVKACVDTHTYEQLIIYFSGHGILKAALAEYWLLSRAPENPNEAVNLSRSIEDARNSGIPHVVFVSDACRSTVKGPPLSGVSGGTIFPNQGFIPQRSEIDIFYATLPGDPAWEVPEQQTPQGYRGIFTDFLLTAVKRPQEDLTDDLDGGTTVVTSRKLKPHMESIVPAGAAELDVRIRQIPELHVESALPKYFAKVDAGAVQRPRMVRRIREDSPATFANALTALRGAHEESGATPPARDVSLAAQIGLTAEVQRIEEAQGRTHFETRTGFTMHGARPIGADVYGWTADPPFLENDAWHVRLHPGSPAVRPSAIIAYESPHGIRGAILPVIDGFIGTVLVDEDGRVISVHFVPAEGTPRHGIYQSRAPRIEKMLAFTAVAARHGRFEVPQETAAGFADRIRMDKALDPVLGLYAAYAYAQVGRYEDVYSVFGYMRGDPEIPVPFDVAMLAARYRGNEAHAEQARYAPFAPLLSQGWSLLSPGDAMARPIHEQLRPCLIPSLWTTVTDEGVLVARNYIQSGDGR